VFIIQIISAKTSQPDTTEIYNMLEELTRIVFI